MMYRNDVDASDLTVEVRDGTASAVLTAEDVFEQNNVWLHLAATIDEAGATVIYVNGTSVKTGTTAAIPYELRTNCYVANSQWADNGTTKGTMDELRLYNKVLTAAEVLLIHDMGM
eukprot:TRINITY_DN12655_c0_g1_i14.p4 TRINITY_DN12655_c0_g1~~TRINITY_DN12655_c0_g1_i14.p4  ORF type:complete len:116 (+),score=44.76 TRINITY_DN12655_c0_g1_i14:2725-3072(+)